jgi:hypothetical protein
MRTRTRTASGPSRSCSTRRRRAQPQCKLFQHVAAKFDSVALEGGLGSLGVVALEGGGVVWLQRERSDSDALERRAKELQDITNRRDEDHANGAKSAAALFVAVKEVEAVHPTTVQNTVQGVELKLRDGARLELIFMPGRKGSNEDFWWDDQLTLCVAMGRTLFRVDA